MRAIVHTLFQDGFRVAARAHQTLDRLQRAREFLGVIVPGDDIEHMSMLLHVDADARYLVIDELNPPRRAAPQPGEELLCLGRAGGMFVGLRCRLDRAQDWEGYGALRLDWPHALYQLQRRANYRVPARPGDISELELSRRGARSLQAECLDLSASGMRVRCAAPGDFELAAHEWIEHLQFRLEGELIECAAQLRFVRAPRSPSGESGTRLIGLALEQLSMPQQRLLQRYVQRRDRELLRDGRL
ncbi:MAG: flagellar brake protein [Betaproteobacteria bacterium]|nr:flagellar brake protein [Betaproteobacteria bacterium]MBU6512118.1 flagellar brake protein [Betaproteobacteria bacterium]MDE1954630.1 flagellar brake protein [Betaproteobacteria bacterium]MDE2152405.1 flagellar brake protein [Betaproteobacteria bacterium]MDE2479009.1 flagellar brake protein [Betaproteobacteria bacterium]